MTHHRKPAGAVGWMSHYLYLVLFGVLLAALLSGGYVTVRLLTGSTGGTGASLPDTRFAPKAGQVYLGVSTHGITDGVDGWDRAAGISGHPALYGRWTTPDGPFA